MPDWGELGTSSSVRLCPHLAMAVPASAALVPLPWTSAFISLLQTLARQRQGEGENPSQPLLLLKLEVRKLRSQGGEEQTAVSTPEFRMGIEKNTESLGG